MYRLFPRYMQLGDEAYGDTKAFTSDHGVAESTSELTEEEYRSARRTVVCKKKKRLLPGASPLIYARLLMEDVRGQAAGRVFAAARKIAARQGQSVLPLPGLDAATGKAPMAGLTAAMEACLHAERGRKAKKQLPYTAGLGCAGPLICGMQRRCHTCSNISAMMPPPSTMLPS